MEPLTLAPSPLRTLHCECACRRPSALWTAHADCAQVPCALRTLIAQRLLRHCACRLRRLRSPRAPAAQSHRGVVYHPPRVRSPRPAGGGRLMGVLWCGSPTTESNHGGALVRESDHGGRLVRLQARQGDPDVWGGERRSPRTLWRARQSQICSDAQSRRLVPVQRVAVREPHRFVHPPIRGRRSAAVWTAWLRIR
jgi:hypothetical protein